MENLEKIDYTFVFSTFSFLSRENTSFNFESGKGLLSSRAEFTAPFFFAREIFVRNSVAKFSEPSSHLRHDVSSRPFIKVAKFRTEIRFLPSGMTLKLECLRAARETFLAFKDDIGEGLK